MLFCSSFWVSGPACRKWSTVRPWISAGLFLVRPFMIPWILAGLRSSLELAWFLQIHVISIISKSSSYLEGPWLVVQSALPRLCICLLYFLYFSSSTMDISQLSSSLFHVRKWGRVEVSRPPITFPLPENVKSHWKDQFYTWIGIRITRVRTLSDLWWDQMMRSQNIPKTLHTVLRKKTPMTII